MTSPGSAESIGQRLKRLRLERGLSQRELASPGVSYAYISRIEGGSRQPSVKALRRLAAKLEVTTEYLETGRDIGDVEARELRLADAELALRLGDPEAAEIVFADVLTEATQAGDSNNATRARIALAFVHDERGDHSVAVRLFEEVLATEKPSAVERLDVFVTLARDYAMAGSPERGVALLEECLDEARSTEPYDAATEVRYANALSYALSDAGDLALAGEILKDALERARDSGDDPYMRVRLYWSLARLAEMEGKSAAALHHIRRAMALLEATDDTIHLARAHLGCAVIMTSQGQGDAALAQLDRAEQLLDIHASGDDIGMVKTQRARALSLLGRADESVTLAREAIELFDRRNEPELGTAYAALGDALTLTGDLEAADAAFREAADLLQEQRRWREATQACQAWGKMLRKAGREAEALDVLERASELGLRTSPSATLER